MKTLKQYFEDVPSHTFRQIIFKEDSSAMYADIRMLFRLEIEKAYIEGYQFGHNDTVESCYGGWEDKAEEYGDEILGTEKCQDT